MPATSALPDWRLAMAQAVREPAELLAMLGLDCDDELLAAARRAATLFPLRVPRGYLARMRPGDRDDPLLRQVLPVEAEFFNPAGFTADPVGDLPAMVSPGLLHKYQGRALLVSTGACAIHCRYCFRREFPYTDANPKKDNWTEALQYLEKDTSIEELILSGGDPLTLSNSVLADLLERLAAIPHLRRLRIHSRLAIVLPERIDAELVALLARSRLQIIHVIHANHANEIDDTVRAAVSRLRDGNTLVFNQAVLLTGINDTVDAQIALTETLINAGIVPYYLHMPDAVRGAHHFDIDEPRALALYADMQQRLPGYMLPRLVREIPGAPAKISLPLIQTLESL
jgi:EF-P beta-lysylation protein EpmB